MNFLLLLSVQQLHTFYGRIAKLFAVKRDGREQKPGARSLAQEKFVNAMHDLHCYLKRKMPSLYIITYRVNYKKAIHRPSSKKPLRWEMLPRWAGIQVTIKALLRVGARSISRAAKKDERARAFKGYEMQPVKKKKHPLIVFAARPRGKTTSLCALTMPEREKRDNVHNN